MTCCHCKLCSGRVAAVSILTALLVLMFDGAIYFTTDADPTQWIAWSAPRTLLTPLLGLFMAGMAGAKPQLYHSENPK
jgi:hypothetical protein